MIKPDGVRKGLIGEVISRFERIGFSILALKLVHLKWEEAEELYSVHRGKSFFEPLVNYVTSGPVVMMVLEGTGAINVVRKVMGATDPQEAQPGTIRGDFALSIEENIVHGSDSKEMALREISLFFPEFIDS
jgi:nucleoside-diphosphate kinase